MNPSENKINYMFINTAEKILVRKDVFCIYGSIGRTYMYIYDTFVCGACTLNDVMTRQSTSTKFHLDLGDLIGKASLS